jgi:hypothetical protein
MPMPNCSHLCKARIEKTLALLEAKHVCQLLPFFLSLAISSHSEQGRIKKGSEFTGKAWENQLTSKLRTCLNGKFAFARLFLVASCSRHQPKLADGTARNDPRSRLQR